MSGPLSDYRVLELTSTVSGPMAGMILADQGADVIKIERPEGDAVRAMSKGRLSGTFVTINRNKRSLAIDMRSGAGLAAVHKPVGTAAVLGQNFRPGPAAGPPELVAVAPPPPTAAPPPGPPRPRAPGRGRRGRSPARRSASSPSDAS